KSVLAGSYGECSLESTYFFTSPVCLGEEFLDGDVHFGFTHNLFHLLLSKVKREDKDSKISTGMFRKLTRLPLTHYSPPEAKRQGQRSVRTLFLPPFSEGAAPSV